MTQPPSRPTTPSIEAQVVRLGLMTPDQVATAMREEAETGRTFDEVVIEHGWVSAEDLARVREPDPPAAPPVAVVPDPPAVAIVPDPEPVAVAPMPEPVENLAEPAQVPIAAVADPEPVVAAESIAAEVAAELYVRLTSGERILAGAFDDEAAAEARARELMRSLDSDGDWPSVNGRFIRPDAVISIDVELAA